MGDRPILTEVSADLAAGEIVSFLGPTGSGKTSLLRLVMGLDPLSGGRVLCEDELLSEVGRTLIAPHQRRFSLVFQDTLLLPFMNVQESVSLGVTEGTDGSRRRLGEITELLRLDGFERRPAWELSGGEQQRVALARSLMVEPRVLLLDEPFSNLDQPFKEELFPALKAYLQREGITTVFVTHDRHEAFYFSDRMFVISQGRLLQCAAPEELYHNPQSREAAELLGECNVLPGEQARALFGRPDHGEGVVLIRPEHLELREGASPNGQLRQVEFAGFYQSLVFVCDDDGPVLKIRAPAVERYAAGEAYSIHLKVDAPVVVLG